jgi:hypothetical protein
LNFKDTKWYLIFLLEVYLALVVESFFVGKTCFLLSSSMIESPYLTLYKLKGLDFLQINHEGYGGKLDDDQILQLTTELQSMLYLTSDEIIEWVVVQFGIHFTKDGMVKLLH